MFKFLISIVGLVLLISLIISGLHLLRVAYKNKKELSQFADKKIVYNNNLGKVLIVYYSLGGNTKQIAENIAKKINAELFEIKTLDKIKLGLPFYLEIKKQLNSKKYQKIEEKMPDFAKYDTIFVGFPVWWYTIATPVLAFLQKANFMNKTTIPFSTQGSNYGTSFTDFDKMAKNAKIGKSASFNNIAAKYDKELDNKINNWLNNI